MGLGKFSTDESSMSFAPGFNRALKLRRGRRGREYMFRSLAMTTKDSYLYSDHVLRTEPSARRTFTLHEPILLSIVKRSTLISKRDTLPLSSFFDGLSCSNFKGPRVDPRQIYKLGVAIE